MSIKSFALIAATIAATASAASADSFIQFGERLDSSSVLEIGQVTSEGAGVLEIYDFSKGELGQLLGTETINAGANADVKVNVGIRPTMDVIALLKVDGEVVAQRDYDVDR
jgi:hypothetical protein